MSHCPIEIRERVTWVIVAFLCGAIALAGCGQRRSDQQVELGDTYLRLGKDAEALAAYEEALRLAPDNADAKLGRARCLLMQKKSEESLGAYEEVMALDPARDAAYLESSKLLLDLGRVKEAEDLAGRYEKVSPERGGVLHAHILRKMGKTKDAEDLLKRLRGEFGQSMAVRLNLASLYFSQNETGKAEQELKSILDEIDPNSAPAHMMLIDVYRKEGRLPEIVQQLETLSGQRPDDVGVKLALARSLLDSGDVDKAEQIARPILEEMPDSGWANYVVGSCLVARGAHRDAVPYLQTAAQALPDQEMIAVELALARSGGEVKGTGEESTVVAESPISAHGPSTGKDDWRGLWRAARLRDLVDKRDEFLAADEPNLRETLVLAALFGGRQLVAVEMAAGLSEGAPPRAYLDALAQRNPEAIMKCFETWQETDGEGEILRENARGFALTALGARGKALAVLSTLAAKHQDNAVALYNLATMFRLGRMPLFSAQVLEKLLSGHPENLEARQMLSGVLVGANELEAARSTAELTYGLFPGDRNAILDLARVYRLTGDMDLALKVLEGGARALPDDAGIRVARADMLLRAGEYAAAGGLLNAGEMPEDLRAAAAGIQAHAAAAQGDWTRAGAICEGIDVGACPLDLRLLLASALIREGKADEAKAAVDVDAEEGRPANGGLPVLLSALGGEKGDMAEGDTALAGRLAENSEAMADYAHGLSCQEARLPGLAAAAFRAVDGAVPGAGRVVGLLMSSLAMGKEIPGRVEEAKAIVEKHADMADAWMGQAGVCQSVGDAAGELAALDKAVGIEPDRAEVRLLRAMCFQRRKESSAAIEEYARLAELRPDDSMVSNNLAYLILETNGDAAKALELAAKALEKQPGNPHVLHTVGLAELRTGKLDESEKHLGMAVEMRPGDPTLLLDFGRLLLAKGRKEEAEKYVGLALHYSDRLGLEFTRRAEAEKVFAENQWTLPDDGQ